MTRREIYARYNAKLAAIDAETRDYVERHRVGYLALVLAGILPMTKGST